MLRRIESLDDYCEFLDREPGELAALHQDLLIRVTEFFGDPTPFEALRQDVLPSLCKRRTPKDSIHVWVPGCATGERCLPSPSRFSRLR